jgi:hypothetical protein
MKSGVRIAVAVGVGYFLGRTHKGRLALTLAAAGVTGRLSRDPAVLVQQGVKLLGSSPEVKALADTVRGRLVEAGRTAAVAAASSQVDALSERLQGRTASLRGLAGRAEEEEEEPGENEDRYEEEEESRPRRRAERARGRRVSPPSSEWDEEPGEEEPGEEEPDEEPQRRYARSGASGRRPVRRTRR